MQSELQIGIIGFYGGHPIDIILPIINESEMSDRQNNLGHCFHIYNMNNTELCLFRKGADGTRRIARLDIRSSCKSNSDMSLHLVKMNDGEICLHTYVDDYYNGLFPLPAQLYD